MNSLISFIIGFVGGAAVATGLHKTGMDRGEVLRLILGVMILAAVAYTALSTYRANDRLAEVAACQQEQNQRFADAIAARSDATTRGNAAQREFLTAVADPTIGPEATAAAFRRYMLALDEIDATRAQNPLVSVECR